MDKLSAVAKVLLHCPYALVWLAGCRGLQALRLSFAIDYSGGSVERARVAPEHTQDRGATATTTATSEVLTVTPQLLASSAAPTPVLAQPVMRNAGDNGDAVRRALLPPVSQGVLDACNSAFRSYRCASFQTSEYLSRITPSSWMASRRGSLTTVLSSACCTCSTASCVAPRKRYSEHGEGQDAEQQSCHIIMWDRGP
ncbi:hypothetical protein Q4I30_001621 [Leishmania utingensis]|uniref:Secreted protein n=1 Tax=Leishmania utingensis TaxID=653362 RepID=A0AAW3ATE2_9TRYP